MAKNKKKKGFVLSNRVLLFLFILAAATTTLLYSQKNSGVLGVTVGEGGTYTKPTSAPSPTTCKDGAVEKFVASGNCGVNKFNSGFYQCKNGLNYQESGCKEINQWYSIASRKCSAACRKITPLPIKPTTPVKPTNR